MEESAISEGFKNLRNGADYDKLYQAALCRQQADWVVGFNYSRLFGCLYNVKGLSLGRVQTPTLAMIVERDSRIKNFVKEPFYSVEIAGNVEDIGFTVTSEKIKDKIQAEDIATKCNGSTIIVKSVVNQEKSSSAPKLYDLTTLQREANRLYGYSASDTLKYAQNLYEQKILTYPRTDSRYITEDMATGIPALVQSVSGILAIGVDINDVNVAQITDNTKVTDHHSIIPTIEATKVNIDSSPAEKNILMLVCTRLLTAVSPKHRYAETVITVENENCTGVEFTTKGKTIIDNGWKAIEDTFLTTVGKKSISKGAEQNEKSLPNLTQGQQFPVTAKLKEGYTSPPKPFTEDTLLSSMENATADDMPKNSYSERAGIGTPATRAEVIETLLKREYVIRKDKQILPTEKGIGVIKILPDADSIKSPILTAQWETDLRGVENGEISATAFMVAVTDYVKKAVAENNTIPEDKKVLFASSSPSDNRGEILGKCPRCSNDVTMIPNAKGNVPNYSCCNRDCKFALWIESKFFTAKKKKLTKTTVIALLKKGRIFMSGLHSEKTGKPYNATIFLVYDNHDCFPSFRMEFEKKGTKT